MTFDDESVKFTIIRILSIAFGEAKSLLEVNQNVRMAKEKLDDLLDFLQLGEKASKSVQILLKDKRLLDARIVSIRNRRRCQLCRAQDVDKPEKLLDLQGCVEI